VNGVAAGQIAERIELLVDAKRYREALVLVHGQIAGGQETAQLWALAARAHICLQENQQGLDAARNALRFEPDNVLAHVLASDALRMLGRHLDAYTAAVEATRRFPDLWLAHHQVAAAAVELADRSPAYRKVARDAARWTVGLAPGEADAHGILGIVAMRTGRRAEARAALGEALRIDPQNATAHHNLALLKVDRGDIAGGLAGLSVSARADPQAPELWIAFDALFRRWLWTTHIGLFVTLQLTRLLGDARRPGPSWPSVAVVAVGAAGLACWTWFSFRNLGRRGVPLLRRVLRASRATAVWFGAIVSALLATVVWCLSPVPDVRSTALLVATGALVIGVVASWVAIRIANRAARQPGRTT